MSDDAMDREAVQTKLNAALVLQYRTALGYTIAAGSLRGVAYAGLAAEFAGWAAEELRGAQALVEKVIAVDGEPATEAAPLAFAADPAKVIQQLIDAEDEGVAALHAVIEDTGQEPHSEALEHILEHEIMRKQRHLDTLRRMASGT